MNSFRRFDLGGSRAAVGPLTRRTALPTCEEVMALLREHRAKLDDLALALLDRETLDGPDAYAAAGLEWVFTDEDLRDTAPAPA